MDHYQSFRDAEQMFARREYRESAALLEEVLADLTGGADGAGHALTDARLLLARSYFHSAQLNGAEAAARAVLEDDPSEAYAALLLARTLERANRSEEAETAMRMATALGAPSTGGENNVALVDPTEDALPDIGVETRDGEPVLSEGIIDLGEQLSRGCG